MEALSEIRQLMSLNDLVQLTGIPRITLFKSLARRPKSETEKFMKCDRSGFPVRGPVISDSTLPTLHALIDDGHTKAAIAKTLELSVTTIDRALKRPIPANTERMEIAA
jgi:hypothetical protein